MHDAVLVHACGDVEASATRALSGVIIPVWPVPRDFFYVVVGIVRDLKFAVSVGSCCAPFRESYPRLDFGFGEHLLSLLSCEWSQKLSRDGSCHVSGFLRRCNEMN